MCRRCGGQRPRCKQYCPPCLRLVTIERRRRHDKKRRRCANCWRKVDVRVYCAGCRVLAQAVALGREPIGAHTMARHCHLCGAGNVVGRGRMYCADCAMTLRREQQRVCARGRRQSQKLAAIRAMRRAA